MLCLPARSTTAQRPSSTAVLLSSICIPRSSLPASGVVKGRLPSNCYLVQDILKLAGKISTLRKAKGWSHDEFEDIAGLHRAYIGAMERGEKNMTLKTLKTVADALGVRVRDLVEDL